MISGNARFTLTAVLLVAVGLFLHTRAPKDVLPPGPSLASLPLQFEGWKGTDVAISPKSLTSLGPGEYIQRQYFQEAQGAGDSYIDLFLAHFPNRQALREHPPDHCIVGSGWSVAESGTIPIALPGYPGFRATRYVITKGKERQMVLFWFLAHGRSLAREDQTRLYLTIDSLRLNRNDAELIRINTALRPGENLDAAQQRLFSFVAQLAPRL